MKSAAIDTAYESAKQKYAELGVNTDQAIETLKSISLSLHCWQGDDVGGFETPDSQLGGGGIMVTGGYPGKARNIDELRTDLEKAFSLIPGKHRLNLHAIYGDFQGKFVERDAITTDHFKSWVQWCQAQGLKLDFNPTCFSHPKADDGFTLSSKDESVRKFWVEHVKRCREIAAYMGSELGSTCIDNVWVPDGSKDVPVEKTSHRALLLKSLDEAFEQEYDPADMKDAVESKLFGIGSESYVVGSHEFYLGYAISRETILCLDMGHFHPTETIADKISAILQFTDGLLLHVSRGIRWDSDHVVILNDDVKAVAEEIVRSGKLDNIYIATDYFDASINRVGAWVIGTRATLKALLIALLKPQKALEECENNGNLFARLALIDDANNLPFGAVWDQFCIQNGVPAGTDWIQLINAYDKNVTSKR
jgi:L-rhamnose isomerase